MNEEKTDDKNEVSAIQVLSREAKENVWSNCVSFSCRRQ